MKAAKFAASLTVLAALLFASTASAYGPTSFEASSTTTTAGAHPDVTTDLVLPSKQLEAPFIEELGNVRNAVVHLPPGLVGDPTAVPQCAQSAFAENACPPASQIGRVKITLVTNHFSLTPTLSVFNMQPRSADETAEIAFSFAGIITIHMPVSVRTDDDYGLTVSVPGISRAFAPVHVVLTTWGVPGDPIHDPERFDMINEPVPPTVFPRVPYFTNPTSCDGPLVYGAEADSYQELGLVNPPLTYSESPRTNCDELEFSPTLKARPTTNAADAPSGLDVDLAMAQNEDPDGTASAALRDAVVTLPEGLVVNPSSANGLQACSPAQIGMTTAVGDPNAHFDRAAPSCPTGASLGRAEVEVPAFADPLKGTVYLASPQQNPFDSLLALYLVVEGHGLVIKLAGKVTADPQTGRLTTAFTENPQQPVSHLRLSLFGGAVAPLRTPATCGKYATTSLLTPWSAPQSGPPAQPKDEYEITQGPGGKGCGTPANAPSFEAGSMAPIAGAYRPFVVNLRREDGTQQFSSVTLSPPPGLLAKLAGTPTCSDADLAAAAAKSGAAEQASPSCPAASAIGTVHAQAGAGPTPYNAPGTAYLTGPYKGAPLSLAIVTPAVAGPFDLGTIVVRTALKLDPKSAQVTAISDPIPTILDGIPLDIRSVSIRLDKPGFTLNPTSCDPTSVGGSLLSTSGAAAALSSRFQLAECGQLKFKPALQLSLKGATKRGGYPALTAVLRPRPGDANIAAVSVALPHSEFLAQEHIRTVCTRVQFAADACPAGSIYGQATATSPLLDYPVSGPVYLRSSDNPLPDLVLSLHGPASQPIRFEAAGRTDAVNGGIRNTFDFVPDVPLTKVTLQLQGGKKGLLVNSRNLCAAAGPAKADALYSAHNGSAYEASPQLKVRCAKAKKKAKGKGKGKHSGSKRG